jgi:hypothetical protein
MFLRIWKVGHHEIVETVLRTRHERHEELTLEEPAGGSSGWTVLSVYQAAEKGLQAACPASCEGTGPGGLFGELGMTRLDFGRSPGAQEASHQKVAAAQGRLLRCVSLATRAR